MADFSEQIARIKKKLIEAKRVDKNCEVFGAKSHKYQIGRPASPKDVEKFENEYSVKLPECYKAFILEVGNGGSSYQNSAAGPFYGIYKLGENIGDLIYEKTEEYLKNDCLIFPEMSDENWESLNKKIDENDNISDEEYEKELGKIYAGILPIGSQGCTYLTGIVINGEHKGKVVNLDMERQKPHFAFEKNFLDWYERWLDEVISGKLITENPSWFGYSMTGSDGELLNKYFSTNDRKEKDNCLDGLITKKSLEPQTIQIIEDNVMNEANVIDTKMLQILCKFSYERAKPFLLKLSKTDLLSVFQFIFWYQKDKSQEWLPIIEQNIGRIKDDETFSYCTYILQNTKSNYAHLIIPFTKNDDEKIRVTAFYNLGLLENKKDLVEVFIEGLNDISNRVIHTTLQALVGIKDKRLLEHYKRIAERFPEEKDFILVNLNHRLKDYGLNNLTIQQKNLNDLEIEKKWYEFWK